VQPEEKLMATGKTPRSKAFKAGLATRKKVLGADYVERAFKNANPFNQPFQDLATEFAWGSVWTRPGLSLRDRSLVTLAQCIALNRPAEIRVHLRGAIRNGVSKKELSELCLHSFLYCGGPASLDAFHTISAALPEIEALEKAAKKKRGK
jgi:4-carboxymuconolactone decarboxylase